MKIIVTGCKGQLGTEILKQLREGRSEIGPIPEKLLNATVTPPSATSQRRIRSDRKTCVGMLRSTRSQIRCIST